MVRRSKQTGPETHKHWSPIIFDQIDDGLVILDATSKIITINRAGCQLVGWSVADAMGLNMDGVIRLQPTPNSQYSDKQNPVSLAIAGRKTLKTTAYLKLPPPANHVPVAVTVSPVKDGSGANPDRAWLLVLRDQTEEHARNEAKTDFVSTASHEMRTPLATIEGYLSLAAAGDSTTPEEIKVYIEQARRATITLSNLFRDLLTASQSEAGHLSSHPSVIDLGEFLPKLVATTDFGIKSKGLEFELLLPGAGHGPEQAEKVINPAYNIYADPDRIRELLTNLIENSVKYTNKGRISLDVRATTEAIDLIVADTGIGIAGVHLPHLFRKFYRVNNNNIDGTGLGLFISKKIVELYDGEIKAESQLGRGTQITVRLPRLDRTQALNLAKVGSNRGLDQT